MPTRYALLLAAAMTTLCAGCTYQGLPGQFRTFELGGVSYHRHVDGLEATLETGWFLPWNVKVINVRTEPPWPVDFWKRPVFVKDQGEFEIRLLRFSECHKPIKITCDIKQDWTVKQKVTLFINPFPKPSMRRDGAPNEYQGELTGDDWRFKHVQLSPPQN